jgi:hypothetical protein
MDLCIDFRAFPAGTNLPDQFSLSGYAVEALHVPGQLDVAMDAGELAMRLPHGIRLTLPVPRLAVTLRVGTFAGPALVEAFAANGASLVQQMVHAPNAYTNLNLVVPSDGPAIHHLTISDGGHEANLASACVEIVVV